MKTVLTIAGSDCSGGAGLQADVKTMTAHKIYAMSAITALTAQNTTGVFGIRPVDAEFLELQLDCIFTDIKPDAVKIGMIPNAKLVRAVAGKLDEYCARHVVLDTVMASTSGSRFADAEAQAAMREYLLPRAELVTPNLREAAILAGFPVVSEADMEKAGKFLCERYGCAVLVKGGHGAQGANDLFFWKGGVRWFRGERIDTANTHGTGCTLSSAIACGLAEGLPIRQSIERARHYLRGALRAGLALGSGNGPVDHCFAIPKLKF